MMDEHNKASLDLRAGLMCEHEGCGRRACWDVVNGGSFCLEHLPDAYVIDGDCLVRAIDGVPEPEMSIAWNRVDAIVEADRKARPYCYGGAV